MAERKFPTWAEDNDLLANGDPNKTDPGLAKQALGWIIEKPLVQYMNWIQNLVGKWVESNNSMPVETTGYEAEAGETILINNTAGDTTGLLPASPLDRQKVTFGGVERFTVYGLTIEGNGNDIMEAGVDKLVLDYDSRLFEFVWDNNSSLWEVSIGNIRGDV